MFEIVDHRLVGVEFWPSKNVGGRMEPVLTILHETAGRITPDAASKCAIDSGTKVSWHVSVERDGTVRQHVPFDVVAWHAGPSSWEGRSNLNACSIGIEMAGPGSLTKRGAGVAVAWFGQSFAVEELEEHTSKAHGGIGLWLPPTAAQVAAVEGILQALRVAYPRLTDVLGHFEVSPGRKVDPSPAFPLADCKRIFADRHAPPKGDTLALQTRLQALGYYTDGLLDDLPGPRLRNALRAFQDQAQLPITGEADAATRAALLDPGAVPMTTGTRAATTKADVASIETVVIKRTSEGNAALELVGAVDKIGEAVTKAQKAKGTGDTLQVVLTWLTSPAGLRSAAVLLVCAVSWWAANKVDWTRVKARIGLGRA